jgi:hypothetical protein
MPYADSLHIRMLAWLHRLLAVFDVRRPMAASAFWLQVVVGTLGVVPAWLVGRRLGGAWGFAAILIGLHPAFLARSLGADNDVWHVVLPLCAAAPVFAALHEERAGRAVAWTGVAACVVGVHAAIWRGWSFGFVVLLAGVLACAAWSAIRGWRDGGPAGVVAQTRGPALVAACFLAFTLILVGARPHGWAMIRDGAAQVMQRASASSPSVRAEPDPRAVEFPSALHGVGELRAVGIAAIRERLGGAMVLFGALVGLVLMRCAAGERERSGAPYGVIVVAV